MPPPSGNYWLRQEAIDLVNDFRRNNHRYASLNAEDMELMEKIIESAEKGLFSGTWEDREYHVIREQYMAEKIREIRKNSKGQKIFAIMGAGHSTLTGYMPFEVPSLASVLKNEMRIASLVLFPWTPDRVQWPYNIIIDDTKIIPFVFTYTGNWPYLLGAN
jgi:hypothetical protein